MSSEKKTLDYAEVRSQFLANEILGLLARKFFHNRKFRIERLDIQSFSEAGVAYIRFKGLAGFPYHPRIKVRFDGAFLRPFVDNGIALSWGDHSDLLKGPIELKIDGTDITGSIDTVFFTRPNHNEYWEVVDLQIPETNEELNRRIGEALGV